MLTERGDVVGLLLLLVVVGVGVGVDLDRSTDRWWPDVATHRTRQKICAGMIQRRGEHLPPADFAPDTRWRGGQGLAGEYSGKYVDKSYYTICSAATCATRAPPDDVPARFVTTFLGERTPVVGRVGLCVRERTRALDTGPRIELSTEPGDWRPRGEAGRPPIGQPAWGWRPWPAGGDGENAAISTGSKIRTLLDEALV